MLLQPRNTSSADIASKAARHRDGGGLVSGHLAQCQRQAAGWGQGRWGGGPLRQYISEDPPRPYAALKSCLISPLCSTAGLFGGERLAGAIRALITTTSSEKPRFYTEKKSLLFSKMLTPKMIAPQPPVLSYTQRATPPPPPHTHTRRFPHVSTDASKADRSSDVSVGPTAEHSHVTQVLRCTGRCQEGAASADGSRPSGTRAPVLAAYVTAALSFSDRPTQLWMKWCQRAKEVKVGPAIRFLLFGQKLNS